MASRLYNWFIEVDEKPLFLNRKRAFIKMPFRNAAKIEHREDANKFVFASEIYKNLKSTLTYSQRVEGDIVYSEDHPYSRKISFYTAKQYSERSRSS